MKIRVLVMGMLATMVLAGCGAGQDAATSRTRPTIPGVNADVEGVLVRNAVVPFAPGGYPPGEDAPVELSIANTGQEQVRLVQVSSEGAGSASVGGGAEVAVAPGELVAVTLQLTGLRQPMDGTASVPVTLTFDNGVEVPLAVPMATPLEPLPRESPVTEQPEH